MTGNQDLVCLVLVIFDLSKGDNPLKVAWLLLSFANYLVPGLQVRLVILDQIIHLSSQLYLLVSLANIELERMLNTGEYPSLKLWKHSAGFFNKKDLVTDDGQIRTKA